MKIEELHEILYDILCAVDDACKAENVPYFLASGTMLGAVRHKDIIPWDDDIDICVWKQDYPAMKAALVKHLPAHYRLIEPEELQPNFYDFVIRVQDLRHHWHEPGEEDVFYDNKQNYICVDIFTLNECANTKLGANLYILAQKITYGLAMGHRAKIDYGKYTTLQKIQAGVLSTIGKCIPMKRIHALYGWLENLTAAKGKKYCLLINDLMPYLKPGMKSEWFYQSVDFLFRNRMMPISKDYHDYLTFTYGDYMQPPKDRSIYVSHMECE